MDALMSLSGMAFAGVACIITGTVVGLIGLLFHLRRVQKMRGYAAGYLEAQTGNKWIRTDVPPSIGQLQAALAYEQMMLTEIAENIVSRVDNLRPLPSDARLRQVRSIFRAYHAALASNVSVSEQEAELRECFRSTNALLKNDQLPSEVLRDDLWRWFVEANRWYKVTKWFYKNEFTFE